MKEDLNNIFNSFTI